MSRVSFISVIVIMTIIFAVPALAQDPNISERERMACNVIRDNISAGNDIMDLVKTGIQMGFDTCFVIQCAVDAGGDLDQVVTGALETGSSSDVVARCAVAAGANVEKLAVIIAAAEPFSLCYLPPGDEVIPVGTSFPGGRDDRRLSPSSF